MSTPRAQQRQPPAAIPAGEGAFLDRTVEVFQPYSPELLTREDAREIAANVTGLFAILLQLKEARVARQRAQETGLGLEKEAS